MKIPLIRKKSKTSSKNNEFFLVLINEHKFDHISKFSFVGRRFVFQGFGQSIVDVKAENHKISERQAKYEHTKSRTNFKDQ